MDFTKLGKNALLKPEWGRGGAGVCIMINWQLFMNNVYTCQPSKAQMACTYLKAKSGICIKVWINSNKYFIVHYLLATCRGVFIKNLEEEDWHLLNESDSDASDFMYHEKMQPDILQEVWDITEEVVNEDFPQGQSKLPSVDNKNLVLSNELIKVELPP